VFAGSSGLLLVSPVLVAASYGLVLLRRTRPVEALLCAAVTVFFLLLACSYYVPYGGTKLGPRFVVPALPFLAIGLGPAFARRPRLVTALAVLSVLPVFALTLIWAPNPPIHQTIWGELARLVSQGSSSRLMRHMTPNALGFTDAGSRWGFGLMVAAACAAFLVAFLARSAASRVFVLVGVACAALGAGAAQLPAAPVDLRTAVSGSTAAAFPGDEVDFTVTLTNQTGKFVPHAVLMIQLPPGTTLLGRPAHERGKGCSGATTLACDLSPLDSHMVTTVELGLRIAPDAGSRLTVKAWSVAADTVGPASSFTVSTGAG